MRTIPAKVYGYAWAGAAVLCWGAMFPVGRSLMERGTVPAEAVAMMRYLLAFPILLAASLITEGRKAFPRRLRDWLFTALLALIGASAMAWLVFLGQETVASVNSSILEAYVPIQVLLIGIIAGKRATLREWAGIVLGFIGSVMVLGALDGSGLRLGSLGIGDLYIFLSGLCWALYTYWGRNIANRLGGLVFATWTVFFGGLWLLIYNLATGASIALPPNTPDTLRVLFLALFPTALAFLGWNQAQKYVPVLNLSFMEYFTPLVAAVIGVAWLREPVAAWQWAGIAVVIICARIQRL